MRPSNKRSRSNKNRPRTLGNVVNRVFDSSGPEGKVRGTPQQIIDKYLVHARDAQLSGDRVAAENFQQHAEHYTRMLNEAQAEMAKEAEQRREQQQQQQSNQNRRNNEPRDDGDNAPSDGEPRAENRDNRDNRGDRSEWKDRRSNRRTPRRDNEGRENDPRDNDQRGGDQRGNDQRDGDQRNTQPRDGGRPRADSGAADTTSESMLVETPESRANAQPAPQQPEAAQSVPATDAPQPEDKPKRARAPRKPRVKKDAAPEANAGSDTAPQPASDAPPVTD